MLGKIVHPKTDTSIPEFDRLYLPSKSFKFKQAVSIEYIYRNHIVIPIIEQFTICNALHCENR